MNFKSPYFYVPVGIVTLLLVVIGWQFVPNGSTPAVLHVMQGDVRVDNGNGFAPATDGMELEEGAKIKTLTGTAYVVLYEGVIIRLQENTEVALTELSKRSQEVRQDTGTTWSKIAKLGGIDGYTVRTPTTTATVRGTSFRVGGALLVIEGAVEVHEAGFTGTVHAGEKLQNGTVMKFSPEDLAAVREELQFELQTLRELRLREVHKDDMAMYVARHSYDATDADIEKFFLDLDAGYNTEDDIRANAKVVTPSMERVFAYDAEIKRTLSAIQAYS